MTTPDWRKLSAIPYSPIVAATLAAVGITEVPPEGRSSVFQARVWDLSVCRSDNYFVLCEGTTSTTYATAQDVALKTRCRSSGPTNEALRQWLRWWGWEG